MIIMKFFIIYLILSIYASANIAVPVLTHARTGLLVAAAGNLPQWPWMMKLTLA